MQKNLPIFIIYSIISISCNPNARPQSQPPKAQGKAVQADSLAQPATQPDPVKTPIPVATDTSKPDKVPAAAPKLLKFGPKTCELNAGTGTCYVVDATLNELSGIAASPKYPNVYWVQNDEGPAAIIYAINPRGEILSTQTLTGVTVTDTEDITIGPGPKAGTDYIYFGDIGDKGKTAGSLTVHRFPEPTIDPAQKAIKANVTDMLAITLSYPGNQLLDFETMFIDPAEGDLYLVQKGGFNVFKATKSLLNVAQVGTAVPMTAVRTTGAWSMTPSGGNMSPSGDEIVLRDETTAWVFKRNVGQSVADALGTIGLTITLGVEFNGEAISFDAKGLDLVTVSENLANSSNTPSPPQPVSFYRRLP